MNEDDLKELCKECGIKTFGERFRFIDKIREIKNTTKSKTSEVNELEETIGVSTGLLPTACLIQAGRQDWAAILPMQVPEVEEIITDDEVIMENSEHEGRNLNKEMEMENGNEDCEMCRLASSSRSPHKCRRCGKVVCNFYCSIQDPDSDNEQHRICKVCPNLNKSSPNLMPESPACGCPHCDDMFHHTTQLMDHIQNVHPNGFSTSCKENSHLMMSEADDSSWKYVRCNECKKLFYDENDLLYHHERVHEYGEICEIYPCDQCGFSGTGVREIDDHKQSHDSGERTRSTNKTKSFAGIDSHDDIEDIDLDNSYLDADWKTTKNDEMLLKEDQHDYDLNFSCEECEYESVLETDLQTHVRRKHEQKSSNKRKIIEADIPNAKKKSKTAVSVSCDICQKIFTRKDNVVRHKRKVHGSNC